jgi:3-methyladenine DNA glycosylase AlkD
MKLSEANNFGRELSNLVGENKIAQAVDMLYPIISSPTAFPTLERIGEPISHNEEPKIDRFLKGVGKTRAEGGWVIIGSILREWLARDFAGALRKSQSFIIDSDIWYGADILGERVVGPALLTDFAEALIQLESWRSHENKWVRRSLGVGVHFWAKRSRGDTEYDTQVQQLLRFLEPLFTEKEIDAIKGIGWGLKTLGKYYPKSLADWLAVQIRTQKYRTLMIRKALTYLPASYRSAAMGESKHEA